MVFHTHRDARYHSRVHVLKPGDFPGIKSIVGYGGATLRQVADAELVWLSRFRILGHYRISIGFKIKSRLCIWRLYKSHLLAEYQDQTTINPTVPGIDSTEANPPTAYTI